jgi:hypothetical protein
LLKVFRVLWGLAGTQSLVLNRILTSTICNSKLEITPEYLYLTKEIEKVMDKQRDSYTDWLKSYPWEAYLTVRLPNDIHPHKSHGPLVVEVLRPLGLFLRSRVAALTVASYGHADHRAHLHVLLASKSGVLTSKISAAQAHLRSTKTTLNSHKDAIDLRPYLEGEHPRYTAEHIVAESDIDWYDKKLLDQIKYTKE